MITRQNNKIIKSNDIDIEMPSKFTNSSQQGTIYFDKCLLTLQFP